MKIAKRIFITTLILFTMLLQNCDNNITITNINDTKFEAEKYISKITSTEVLPKKVKSLLINEKLLDNSVKFPLAYYLIPATDIKLVNAKEINQHIISQLYLEISGVKYYKLFVHPDMELTYSFLKHAYRYIGSEDTEFYGSPTTAIKTIVVWNKNIISKIPFVIKTEIDERTQVDDNRSPASKLPYGAKTVQMIFKRDNSGLKDPIEGQQVTEIPDYTP